MFLVKSLRRMPPLVTLLCFSFLLLPTISGLVLGVPHGILEACALWGGPITLSWAVVRKPEWILPLFTSQCLLLGAMVLTGEEGRPALLAQLFLIGFMVYMAFLQKRNDALYPLLTRNVLFWRRSVRFEIGRAAKLITSDEKKTVSAVLQDCSVTGMALSVSPDGFRENFRDSSVGEVFQVAVSVESGGQPVDYRLPVELVWKAEIKSGEGKLGCRNLDLPLTRAYLESETAKRKTQLRLADTNEDSRLERDIQHSAFLLWILCAALAALIGF